MKSQAIDERIQKLEAKQEQNRNLLAQLKARKSQAERKVETRRKILVGAVALNKARQDPEVAAQLIRWLDEGLTTSRDRTLFSGLTPEPPSKESCPRNS